MDLAASSRTFDTIVVGSGFGGVMAAYPLVMAGERVLMLERGDWVTRGPQNWEVNSAHEFSEHFCSDTPYRVDDARRPRTTGSYNCVGGPSVFYGGVAFRFREEDFAPGQPIVGNSEAEWPFSYVDLAPYYDRAEVLLGVAGDDRNDPTAPARHSPYPHSPAALARPAQRVADAARRLGLHPFPLPLAINYSASHGRAVCQRCGTCDGFACAIGAKNDLATGLIPTLQAAGLELRTNTVVVHLGVRGRQVHTVSCVDRLTGAQQTLHAARVIVAAGTLASPHLLLNSGLERYSPAAQTIGRYLMRHLNLLTIGVFPFRTNPAGEFHKQVGIHDFYFGAPDVDPRIGKLGGIQQITAPGPEFIQRIVRPPFGHVAALGVPNALGLISIAEDQPIGANHVAVDPGHRDRFGLLQLRIRHRHTARDLVAGRSLVRQSRRILREAGAWFAIGYDLRSFSHAVGTVRMGRDEASSPLDDAGRFRGLDNLFVADGSTFPTSGGVNPSLTIAANALRIGSLIAGRPLLQGSVRAPEHEAGATAHVR